MGRLARPLLLCGAVLLTAACTRVVDGAAVLGFGPGAKGVHGVNVDTILQVVSDEIVFSAPLEDREACDELLRSLGVEWSMRDDLGKVSLVGAGMKSHPGIAAKTFATLEEIGVEAKVISTSPIKIACHVRTEDVPRAVTALHDAFDLELD